MACAYAEVILRLLTPPRDETAGVPYFPASNLNVPFPICEA
jgi:hypothetical protein